MLDFFFKQEKLTFRVVFPPPASRPWADPVASVFQSAPGNPLSRWNNLPSCENTGYAPNPRFLDHSPLRFDARFAERDPGPLFDQSTASQQTVAQA